jgi:hypothetical protein
MQGPHGGNEMDRARLLAPPGGQVFAGVEQKHGETANRQ